MTRDSYEFRLRIPCGDNPRRKFYTKSGTLLATGYVRVVIGDRGPYVEFAMEHLNREVLEESTARHVYYIEFRSIPDNVKVYCQLKVVDYADYVVGMNYVSPFELYDAAGVVLIEKLKERRYLMSGDYII